MFRKTRWQLVLLNSSIFFVILMFFGAVLYFFTQHRLYLADDEALKATALQIKQDHSDALNTHHDVGHDNDEQNPHHMMDEHTELRQTHIVYVLRDGRGKYVGQMPPNTVASSGLAQLPASTPVSQFKTIQLAGVQYRMYTLNVAPGLVASGDSTVREIQLLYNEQDDKILLASFLKVVEISTVIGALLAMIAGLYLASRALVPIQRSWERQQQFVADASHELRTPITVIQMHLERLFRHPKHTIEQESENIAKLLKESNRMRRLVQDLLTLANVDSNQLLVLRKPVQLDKLLDNLIEQFRYLAMDKETEIVAPEFTPITISADEERIRQLFTILLDNAVKYTHRGGSIEVTCEHTATVATVTVADHGEGISPGDLPHIFERFYRADKARSTEGTGLGLAIAKWIVDEHNGKIRVTSELGKGTTMRVSLPVGALVN